VRRERRSRDGVSGGESETSYLLHAVYLCIHMPHMNRAYLRSYVFFTPCLLPCLRLPRQALPGLCTNLRVALRGSAALFGVYAVLTPYGPAFTLRGSFVLAATAR
jgi:hypothetical protein